MLNLNHHHFNKIYMCYFNIGNVGIIVDTSQYERTNLNVNMFEM